MFARVSHEFDIIIDRKAKKCVSENEYESDQRVRERERNSGKRKKKTRQ